MADPSVPDLDGIRQRLDLDYSRAVCDACPDCAPIVMCRYHSACSELAELLAYVTTLEAHITEEVQWRIDLQERLARCEQARDALTVARHVTDSELDRLGMERDVAEARATTLTRLLEEKTNEEKTLARGQAVEIPAGHPTASQDAGAQKAGESE
jgi:hypothetical protein